VRIDADQLMPPAESLSSVRVELARLEARPAATEKKKGEMPTHLEALKGLLM
jgi:hypothetical protein